MLGSASKDGLGRGRGQDSQPVQRLVIGVTIQKQKTQFQTCYAFVNKRFTVKLLFLKAVNAFLLKHSVIQWHICKC